MTSSFVKLSSLTVSSTTSMMTMMMVITIIVTCLVTTIVADCNTLKSVVTSKDPIFGAKPDSCDCANGGEAVNCNVNRPCLSLEGVDATTTVLSGQSYKASVTSSTPGETFTSNTIVDTCFKYNNDHPTFSNTNVCITMVYDSLGGPAECTKMTVNSDECHFCQSCAIPAGVGGGGSSFIFNCTDIGYGENYKDFQAGGGCTKYNAQDTIAQFLQNQQVCTEEEKQQSSSGGSSSAAASPGTTTPPTGGGDGLTSTTTAGNSGYYAITLMMMLSVTIGTTISMMIF